MPFYANTEQLYACMETLFNRILEESPSTVQAITASRLIIRLRCTAPSGEMTLNGRRQPVQVKYGASSVRPDLDVELTADTLHSILLDQLSTKKALAKGLLKVRGPLWKAPPLIELLRQGQAFYTQVLHKQGLAP